MRRVVFATLIATLFIDAKVNPKDLFSKIKKSKSSLLTVNKEKSITNKQLNAIAKKISKLNLEITEYDKKLYKLNSFLSKEEKKYKESISEINSIDNIVDKLDKDIEIKTKEFAKKLSQQLGSVVAQNKTVQKSEKSIVLKEILNRYKVYNQQELLKISRNIEEKNRLRKSLLKRRDKISKNIKNTQKQKKLYKEEKLKKKKLLKKLAIEEKKYSKKLRDIFKRQTVIRLTLAKLNLIKDDTAKEAKRSEIELKERIKELKNIRFTNDKVKSIKVKQYSSSYYRSSSIYKYRGAKTIAPLKRSKVIKRFGIFIDPIYKIKSHSDSLTLISKSRDKRVFNILNGEVSYIGKNSMLGKIIVIKHRNGLHTIYADLYKFSPFLKVGSKVKKGTVIGKVKRKLIFEVTKNGKFINPIRLINI